MNTLPQDLIILIRPYDRHPCGDMMSNLITIRYDNVKLKNSQKKGIPNTKFRTVVLCVFREDSTEEDAITYESEVVERNIDIHIYIYISSYIYIYII